MLLNFRIHLFYLSSRLGENLFWSPFKFQVLLKLGEMVVGIDKLNLATKYFPLLQKKM